MGNDAPALSRALFPGFVAALLLPPSSSVPPSPSPSVPISSSSVPASVALCEALGAFEGAADAEEPTATTPEAAAAGALVFRCCRCASLSSSDTKSTLSSSSSSASPTLDCLATAAADCADDRTFAAEKDEVAAAALAVAADLGASGAEAACACAGELRLNTASAAFLNRDPPSLELLCPPAAAAADEDEVLLLLFLLLLPPLASSRCARSISISLNPALIAAVTEAKRPLSGPLAPLDEPKAALLELLAAASDAVAPAPFVGEEAAEPGNPPAALPTLLEEAKGAEYTALPSE